MEQLIAKAAWDLANSLYPIALTGAGISTESGISDFRGPKGIWTLNPEAERRAYRSYERFLEDPKGWWEELLTQPRVGFLGNLEEAIPNPLHEKAGTKKLLEYHGSIAKLRCVSCELRFRRDEFDLANLIEKNQLPPRCPECRGIIKSDTVFFGEPIPSDVAQQSLEEAWKCDLMLICGTSAVIYPFANLPRIAKQKGMVTVIEVNADPTPLTEDGISDYLIQGQTGEILPMMVEEVKRIKK